MYIVLFITDFWLTADARCDTINTILLDEVKMNFEQFEEFLLSEDCFENHDVSFIDEDGKQHYLDQTCYPSYLAKTSYLITSRNTIKVEQFERQFGYTDRTAHIFYNKAFGPSFDIHSDPIDVLIECLDGIKYMEVDGKEVILQPHDYIHIPANTKHRALNYKKALMVSYGIGDTETLKRIHQND